MITLTVNIDNKKSEKAVKAVLDALGLNYNIDKSERLVDEAQTLEEYNADLEAGNSEIEQGDFISATQLKAEASKW
ncbi:hypothetical protein SRABI27_02497 [Pedobacter sp. Bi27]|uniref:hypothetical protein n=1 Tax=unclassified Pedobacter TaxID=2628915 RepID=UPI001DF53EAC|nr:MULTISPECIES: hypothetical protein [unclassified Pedobacter]CAH0231813.1 hypothetical protein SRABI27_02497 [Pedobacter sp. Bi27]CAH0245162.1 hypothetical protein SRABI36_03070 [Pedobacter sp. Bi36]CAH0270686.1 hypothetical protein SRABI126_03470 [Pedobacter sp. Bi126]